MTSSSLFGPLLVALATAGQTPEPSPSPTEHTIYTVSPGISGFIAFFVLAIIGWLLFRSLTKHMRRVDQAELSRKRLAEDGPDGVQSTAVSPEGTASGDAEPGDGAGR